MLNLKEHSTVLALALTLGVAGCGESQENTLQVPAVEKENAAQTVTGFADLHNHLFSEYAYQGAWYHGTVLGPEGGDDDYEGMGMCSGNARSGEQDHAMTYANMLCGVAGVVSEDICVHNDRTFGFDDSAGGRQSYSGWPTANSFAHQQNWWGHIYDSWGDGLRLMVVPMVNFRILCELMEPSNYKYDYGCEDLGAVDLEIAATKEFANMHNDWVEIAYSGEDARRIANEGKMALVLAIEVTDIFPTGEMDSEPMTVSEDGAITDRGGVFTQLQHYYDQGIRSIQLGHEFDSRFAGVAVYSQIFPILYALDDFINRNPGELDHIKTPGERASLFGFDLDENGYNRMGLTEDGVQLVEAMMDLGMPVDIAHLSHISQREVYALAKANNYHPLYHSHAKLADILTMPGEEPIEKHTPNFVVDMMRVTGGMIGMRTINERTITYGESGVPNDCDGSSKSFAQLISYADKELNIPVGYGIDLNGFATQTQSRFGEKACKSAPDEATQAAQQALQIDSGTNTLFDNNGLAHIGLLGRGLHEELREMGVDMVNLDSSAEAFIALWERAEDSNRVGPYTAPPVAEASILNRHLEDGYGLKVASIISHDDAEEGIYTLQTLGSGSTRTVNLKLNGSLIDSISYDESTQVSETQWAHFRFADHLTIKIGGTSADLVALTTLDNVLFSGDYPLELAYP